MGNLHGLCDHPLRASCSTCRFSGSDGFFGEVPTCDVPESVHVDRWLESPREEPCPGWLPAHEADQRGIEDLEKMLEPEYNAMLARAELMGGVTGSVGYEQ